MSFDILLSHNAIGWDFDNTLVEHPNSERMHAFINAHPEKRHVIVTFRTHGMVRSIWRELSFYPDAPRSDQFVGILNIDDAAWEAHNRHTMHRHIGRLKGPLTPEETYYVEWKGMICAEHGLTVMVDDRVDHVLEGCRKYGVAFINPDDL